jgi:hypothetical protein
MALSLSHLNRSALTRHFGVLLLILAAASFGATSTHAQSRSAPAPGQRMEIAVIGDSVAHDLARGMEDFFAGKPHIRVVDKTRFATGLVRTDYYDWNKVVRDFLRRHHPAVIFVVIGGNDRQTIRRQGKRYDPLTKSWFAEYDRLVAHFMDDLKQHTRGKVYWVGLPPVRSEKMTADYRKMNRLYKREAEHHGFHYVSIWKKFLDASGEYSSFGDNLNGVRRRLRKGDGEHFTKDGRAVFASYVARAAGLAGIRAQASEIRK